MSDLIFCLMGPTASGKTDLACSLVERFPFEIISVDSAMIYRGMDVGTAKPDLNTLKKAPHQLIDIIDPNERYSAADFCSDVEQQISAIHQRNKIPLLVGGTMMYFRALQQGLAQLPEADEGIRQALLEQAQNHGWPYLHERLQKLDPPTASKVHPHDSQRIQRAIEVYELTKQPLSALLNSNGQSSPRSYINLKLMVHDRAWLHQRIAARFEHMLDNGLVDETAELIQQWQLDASWPSMRCVGYRQACLFLEKHYDYDTLKARGIAATRQLAKRQLTWLRSWPQSIELISEGKNLLPETIAVIKKIMDNNEQHI